MTDKAMMTRNAWLATLEKFKYELENQISQKLFTKKIIEIGDEEITKISRAILNRKIDPFTAVDNIIKE